MNKKVVFLFFGLLFFYSGLKAQTAFDSWKKIDMQNLKKQPYLIHTKRMNCDSTQGTTLEMRICANLELQKQDSLLQLELNTLIRELKNDTASVKKLRTSQEIWERYRYQFCDVHVAEKSSSYQMISFMKCAIDLTINRRKDIEQFRNEH